MTFPVVPVPVVPLVGPAATSPLADGAAGLPLPPSATCANCLAPLRGEFCSACGAPALDRRPLTVARFVGDIVNELTNIDSVTMRTLHSLFTRPGELTQAYLAGRTRFYLSPVRVYLLMFAALLFGQALLPNTDAMYRTMEAQQTAVGVRQQREVAAAVVRQGTPPTPFQRAVLALDPAVGARRAVRSARLMGESRWIQLINAITWGALLALLYRGRRRSFAEHVVFALHLLAFNMLLILAFSAVRSTWSIIPAGRPDLLMWVQWVTIGAYFFVAARRLFAETAIRTGVKSVLFVTGAQASMLLITFVAIVYSGASEGVSLARRQHEAAAAGSVAAPVATAPRPAVAR